ncbi:sulfatase-like hydrolase/transferase [Flammeovirga aprica JL-4]|uniref:Sulfatase-like hydrolase/transferase n=2 Tax=Flammeovirga aprica TaxID=29528 RepID=A0A7X9P471_9BACT|nr:sulfatase-like hydrolase/transferase [Flammeovirga aprica JL-4]
MFMKWIFIILFFVQVADCFAQDKPNVILILVDDQGYGDIGALGNPYIKTPHIDQLYTESSRFTDFHVSPTCAPTRASLLSGRHCDRAGVWHTVNGRSLILERETLMAQTFKENGYRTGIFGKWHLGDNYPFRPQDKGFEEVLVHHGGGIGQTMDYFDNDYFDDVYHHNGEPKQFEGYCTDVWFENAKKFIDQKGNEPFFCYIPTNAAHSPYFVADKYSAPYKDNKAIPNPNFYGMITNVDENIGSLMTFLKEKDILDNTIIIFTTDNGTAAGAKVEGHRFNGFVVKGFNDGMRGIKASIYEGGHRVPLFIHWNKGNINKGRDIDALTAHYDLFPTLIELCDLKQSKPLQFDGKSLVSLLKKKNSKKWNKDRIVIVDGQRTEVPQPWLNTTLMQDNWRLVNGEELYDLKSDPEQRNNIAAQHPSKMKTLKEAYAEWWEELAPTFADEPYIHLGAKEENPTTLHCHDWHTEKVSPWKQDHIRTGYRDNGYWSVKVVQSGVYNIKLRRWPKETNLALGASVARRPALAGTSVTASKKGKSLAIKKASIKIQHIEEEKEVNTLAQSVDFQVRLEKGTAKLDTKFILEDNSELGAYYVEVEYLPQL